MKLDQKYFWFARKVEIKTNSVYYFSKDHEGVFEAEIPFEEVGTSILTRRYTNYWYILTIVILFSLGVSRALSRIISNNNDWSLVIVVFVVNAGMIFYYLTLIVQNSFVSIRGETYNIVLFRDSPSEDRVKQFAELVLQKKKEYFRNKYGKLNSDKPKDQMIEQFNWLKDNNYINDLEYDELKLSLDENNKKTETIGFVRKEKLN